MNLLLSFNKAVNNLLQNDIRHQCSSISTLVFNPLIFALILYLVASPVAARLAIKETFQTQGYQSQPLYAALTAEIYNQLGEEKLAVDHYHRLAAQNDDPAIAKRVTELATVTGQIAKALDTSKRWVELAPNNLKANQYLALLYLRNSHFKSSVQQLNTIYQLLEKSPENTASQNQNSQKRKSNSRANVIASSESLKFIGAMLAAESHHEKAHQVFELYLKQFGKHQYQWQQKLISADLAMKAKNYTAVVLSLELLDGLDTQNLVDASVMKAKALQKLHQTSKAIHLLASIKDYDETNDSNRLELVRLLVLDNQKKRAIPTLEKLIKKHPKNNDLLKSLIALQIDQSLLKKADINIRKLRLEENYTNDANYFYGEVLEKKGSLEKALKSYQKVNGGSFIENAHKKTIQLTGRLNGQAGVNEYFNLKQKNTKKIKHKAYWFKLQADHLFDTRKYNQASDLYTQAIILSPKNALYRYYRGLANERLGKLDFAEKDFNFVINKRKNNAAALNALGYMLSVNTSRLSEAKKFIKKAYRIKPNDPVIIDSLGFVLFKTGDLITAERYLRKAFRLIKTPEVASHLISVLAALEQHQEARLIFDEMNKKYPNNKMLNDIKHYLQFTR